MTEMDIPGFEPVGRPETHFESPLTGGADERRSTSANRDLFTRDPSRAVLRATPRRFYARSGIARTFEMSESVSSTSLLPLLVAVRRLAASPQQFAAALHC